MDVSFPHGFGNADYKLPEGLPMVRARRRANFTQRHLQCLFAKKNEEVECVCNSTVALLQRVHTLVKTDMPSEIGLPVEAW